MQRSPHKPSPKQSAKPQNVQVEAQVQAITRRVSHAKLSHASQVLSNPHTHTLSSVAPCSPTSCAFALRDWPSAQSPPRLAPLTISTARAAAQRALVAMPCCAARVHQSSQSPCCVPCCVLAVPAVPASVVSILKKVH